MNIDEAKTLACIFLSSRLRESLVQVEMSEGDAYGFNPQGWITFSIESENPHVGGAQHIAVNKATGEVRLLGHIGE